MYKAQTDLRPSPNFRHDTFTPNCVKLIPSSYGVQNSKKSVGYGLLFLFRLNRIQDTNIHVKLAAQNSDV